MNIEDFELNYLSMKVQSCDSVYCAALLDFAVLSSLPHPQHDSGLLAAEEEKLYKLRVEKETVAREQLLAERQKFEEEAKQTQVRDRRPL